MSTGPIELNPTTVGQEAAQNLVAPRTSQLIVPPSYTEISGATAVPLTSADHWCAYRYNSLVDYLLDSISVYKAAVTDADAEVTIALYSDNNGAPGTLLQTLGSFVVDADAGWLRLTFTGYQLQRRIPIWRVFKGQAAKAFSLAGHRWNTNRGSMFPDNIMIMNGGALYVTTNGGTNWSVKNTTDGKPSMLCVVENSTENHSPQLLLGRESGAYEHIPGSGLTELAAAGARLSLEDCTAETAYNLYGFNNDGQLAIEASTIDRIISDGIEVKATDPTRRYLGRVRPVTRIDSYVAPIDVMDKRRVIWPGMRKIVGKLCPYAASTVWNTSGISVSTRWNGNDDFVFDFEAIAGSRVSGSCGAYATGAPKFAFRFDDYSIDYSQIHYRASQNYMANMPFQAVFGSATNHIGYALAMGGTNISFHDGAEPLSEILGILEG